MMTGKKESQPRRTGGHKKTGPFVYQNGDANGRKFIPPLKPGVLRIVALGGFGEVGRNMMFFEYEKDILIVDMGLQFPDENMHGVDYIIPNVSYLEDKKGITCNSPKDCFREAYRHGLIEYDDAWIGYVDMRNETVHTYKEEVAEKIYAYLPIALKHFEALFAAVKEKIKE